MRKRGCDYAYAPVTRVDAQVAAAARRAAAAEAAAERAAREGREADARGAERLDGLRRRLADAEAAAARARAEHVAELANLKSSLKELEARAPPVLRTVSLPALLPRPSKSSSRRGGGRFGGQFTCWGERHARCSSARH